jgi:hypothetical protein
MREQIRIEHKEAQRTHNSHVNVDNALKGQVIDTINNTCICEMHNKHAGHLGITTRNLLDHLLERHRKRTKGDLERNNKQMNEPIDAAQTIDAFFNCITNCTQCAADGDVPHTTK